MPELPEAETIVRGLRPAITGRRIERVEVPKPDVLREGRRSFSAKVRGRTIGSVERRAKNVLIVLDRGRRIAVNLGMTGQLLPFPRPPRGRRRPTHPAVRFRFDDGSLLVFNDTRRFGTVECLDPEEWSEREARFGPEPLDPAYAPSQLAAALGTSRAPIRSWLLDQRRIAGIGNIYAAEALFLSGIHPERPARSIDLEEATRLHGSIRMVLEDAIDEGGTTIRDYRNAIGGEGGYARLLFVYGRHGRPCRRCGAPIERLVISNRSAFFCPTCQPPRRP
jgi:formamidopyrimidine-DNA glycosylase